MAPPRIDLRGSFQRQVCAYGGMYVMRSQGRARLPFLLSKEPCTSLFPGQTGQGSNRVVAGAGAHHHLVDCQSTRGRGGQNRTTRSRIATTDRRRPARPLLSVDIPVVVPAIGGHDIRTVITGIPRAVVAAFAVTDVSTPTTRAAEAVAGGGAATAGNATDVDLHYGSPTTTAIS